MVLKYYQKFFGEGAGGWTGWAVVVKNEHPTHFWFFCKCDFWLFSIHCQFESSFRSVIVQFPGFSFSKSPCVHVMVHLSFLYIGWGVFTDLIPPQPTQFQPTLFSIFGLFSFKTSFPLPHSVTTLISKDVELYCASFTATPAKVLNSNFWCSFPRNLVRARYHSKSFLKL